MRFILHLYSYFCRLTRQFRHLTIQLPANATLYPWHCTRHHDSRCPYHTWSCQA